MGCQQSLCAGPSATDEYDDDQSHEWDGLEDGERRALRAHRRRCAEPVRSLSTTSLAAQGPSIYRADIGPLTRLPRGFDPFAMACKLIKKGKASDYSSSTRTGRANGSRNGGQADVDEIFDLEQVLVRRFGLGTLPDKSRMPKKKTKKKLAVPTGKRDMLLVYTLACRMAPATSRLQRSRDNSDAVYGSTGKCGPGRMAASAQQTECRFAWTEPEFPDVSYRVRARRVSALTSTIAPTATSTPSLEKVDYDPTRPVNMTTLGRLSGGGESSAAADEVCSILLQGPRSDPVKPAAFAWAAVRSSSNLEMHIDVEVVSGCLSGDSDDSQDTTTRGRVVLPLDPLDGFERCGRDDDGDTLGATGSSEEEAHVRSVLGLPVMDKWLPMRALEKTQDDGVGDRLGRVIGLIRVMAGRVICSDNEALDLVRIVNHNASVDRVCTGTASQTTSRTARARARALARELSLAMESAVCTKTAVERVPPMLNSGDDGGGSGLGRGLEMDDVVQLVVDEDDANEERSRRKCGPLLRRGSLYYDEFGFMVPSMESPVDEQTSQLLRRQWLHLREYHAELSMIRSVEWTASEWFHDHNLVGSDAQKLLITSHLSSTRITSGVLSHSSTDSVSSVSAQRGDPGGAASKPSTVVAESMKLQSARSSKRLVQNSSSDAQDSPANTMHSRYSSTPKMVMRAIGGGTVEPLLKSASEKQAAVRDESEENGSGASRVASSDLVSFHIVSNIDASVNSKRAYQKHLAGVIPKRVHASSDSWDMRPLTGPNRAHTPSDVGHTYEELVQKMHRDTVPEAETARLQLPVSSSALTDSPVAPASPSASVSTNAEGAAVLLTSDSGSELSRQVSLSRGARLQYQRTVSRTPAMARMVWSGAVPMSEREDLYLRASGASTRRLAEGVHYYSRLRYQVILLFEKKTNVRDGMNAKRKGPRRASDRDRSSSPTSDLKAKMSSGALSSASWSREAGSSDKSTQPKPSLFSVDSFTYDMDDSVFFALQMKHRNLGVVMKQIDADVPRTFGGCRALEGEIVGKTGEASPSSSSRMRKRLGRVLKCYAMRNPSLGYCQSMNLVVGLFLSIGFSEESSFWLLTELAERIVPGYWVPSMTDTQIDTRTAVDLVRMRMGGELGKHLDELGVPLSVVVWQMILPLFISKGSTLAAVRLLDVIFYECSSLPLLAFVLALLEPWKEDLLEAEDLPDAMDVIMSAPSLLVDVDLTMQQAFDLVGANGTGLKKKKTAPAPAGDDGALEQEENNRGKNGYRSNRLVSEPSITNHLVSTDELDDKMSSIEQLRINMASLRKRHATAYEPHAEQSIRDATKRRHLTTSGLDLEAFDRVYSTFVEESRIASSEHGIKDYRRLSSLDNFATVIRVVAPGLVSTDNLAANLFEAFDSDGTGSVDVDELFCGISILSPMAAASRKMEVCFDLFDLNSDGFISGADLVEMLSTVVRLNRHHREVSESVGGERPSMELNDERKGEVEAKRVEEEAAVEVSDKSALSDAELLEIVRSQLANLGKTMTDIEISFKDFCDVVNSHPQILSAMQLNTSEGSKSSAGVGTLDFENPDSLPRRRRASTATF